MACSSCAKRRAARTLAQRGVPEERVRTDIKFEVRTDSTVQRFDTLPEARGFQDVNGGRIRTVTERVAVAAADTV